MRNVCSTVSVTCLAGLSDRSVAWRGVVVAWAIKCVNQATVGKNKPASTHLPGSTRILRYNHESPASVVSSHSYPGRYLHTALLFQHSKHRGTNQARLPLESACLVMFMCIFWSVCPIHPHLFLISSSIGSWLTYNKYPMQCNDV